MVYIEINNERYAVKRFNEMAEDYEWNRRKTCHVTVELDYETAKNLFKEDMEWSLITAETYQTMVETEDGMTEPQENIVENSRSLSEYSMVGDMTIHRDGLLTVVMGQPTAEELLAILLGE